MIVLEANQRLGVNEGDDEGTSQTGGEAPIKE
jgi:hypothetical protein